MRSLSRLGAHFGACVSRFSQQPFFGSGEPGGHSSGRRTWRLADHADLLVRWRVTEAAQIETDMITQFRADHGYRPFANMRT